MSPLRGSTQAGARILIIGGSPTVESSDVSNSSWTGVVMLGDHSAYLAKLDDSSQLASGVQAGLNSSADIYLNTIYSNTNDGIFVNRSKPEC